MEIKTAAVMGAGAVGAYEIYCMMDRLGEDFWIIADGERKKRLEKRGITINRREYFPIVKAPGEDAAPDLLMIATKYDGLLASLDDIEKVVGPNTQVLVLLNGIDSEEIVASRVGEEHVIYSFMRIVSRRDDEGITFNAEKTPGIFFGEKDGSISERVLAIDAFLEKCDVHHLLSRDIITDQWDKFALNITNNLPQAVFGVGYGAYLNSAHVNFIRDKLTEEVIKVAAAEGIKVTVLPANKATGNKTRFSTLQDLDAKRHTEIEMFLGVFLKRAAAHGIETPYAEYTYHAIKILEEKNDGLFSF